MNSVRYHPDVVKRLGFRQRSRPPSSSPAPGDTTDAENAQWDVRSVEAGPIEEDVEDVPRLSTLTAITLLVIGTGVCR
jgi:hypothetical protein